jgi:hypothetical protein
MEGLDQHSGIVWFAQNADTTIIFEPPRQFISVVTARDE